MTKEHPGDDHDESAVDEPRDTEIPDLGATLRAALAADEDVRHTARRRVDRALHARSAAAGYTSLLSCAIETFRHLLTNPPRPADRYTMLDELHTGSQDDDPGGDDG